MAGLWGSPILAALIADRVHFYNDRSPVPPCLLGQLPGCPTGWAPVCIIVNTVGMEVTGLPGP